MRSPTGATLHWTTLTVPLRPVEKRPPRPSGGDQPPVPYPDLILCSPARRARDTLAIATAELETRPPTRIVEDLYDFGDGSGPLEVIRTQGGTAQRLMLVGHNPAFEELAKRLVGSGPADLRKALRQKYPTGALAVIGFNTSRWADIAEGKGRLKRFIRPRDLAAAGDA